jgi:hypothetical protein
MIYGNGWQILQQDMHELTAPHGVALGLRDQPRLEGIGGCERSGGP